MRTLELSEQAYQMLTQMFSDTSTVPLPVTMGSVVMVGQLILEVRKSLTEAKVKNDC